MLKLLTTNAELAAYDTWVRTHAEGNLWQSFAWKTYQEALGREVRVYVQKQSQVISYKLQVESLWDMTALVVIDRTIAGYCTWDLPRGPLVRGQWSAVRGPEALRPEWESSDQFLRHVIDASKKDRCIALTLSPKTRLTFDHFPLTTSSRHVQPLATRVIDLTLPEEDILGQMHQKGRYNIKVAEKEGVSVRRGSASDIDCFYDLLRETSGRDAFRVSKKSHYDRFLTALESSFILIAEYENKPIAGLLGVMWNSSGIYYYGASSYAYRNLMAPYALQWAAIRLCKAAGCTSYDLLGVSPEPAPMNDPWIGISDFKRKFGGRIVTYTPEQTLVLQPLVKKALEWKRKVIG